MRIPPPINASSGVHGDPVTASCSLCRAATTVSHVVESSHTNVDDTRNSDVVLVARVEVVVDVGATDGSSSGQIITGWPATRHTETPGSVEVLDGSVEVDVGDVIGIEEEVVDSGELSEVVLDGGEVVVAVVGVVSGHGIVSGG
jgi:hypothetical protein